MLSPEKINRFQNYLDSMGVLRQKRRIIYGGEIEQDLFQEAVLAAFGSEAQSLIPQEQADLKQMWEEALNQFI